MCKKLGISYNDMMRMTLLEIESIGKASIEQSIDELNQNLYVAYQQAALTGVATNNPKRFPNKAPKVRHQNKLKSGVADPKAVYDKVWQIAAMCGHNVNGPAGN